MSSVEQIHGLGTEFTQPMQPEPALEHHERPNMQRLVCLRKFPPSVSHEPELYNADRPDVWPSVATVGGLPRGKARKSVAGERDAALRRHWMVYSPLQRARPTRCGCIENCAA